jgi:hypothetical protein
MCDTSPACVVGLTAAVPLSRWHSGTKRQYPCGRTDRSRPDQIDTLQIELGDRLHPVSANRVRRFSSVSSFSMTIPTPARDMASPPSQLHRATATSTPLRASSTGGRCRRTRSSTASAHSTAVGAFRVRSSHGHLLSRTCQLSVARRRRRHSGLRVCTRHARLHALPHIRWSGMPAGVGGRARQSEAGLGFAIEASRGRNRRGQVQQSVMFSRGRIQVIEQGESSTVRPTRRLIRRRGVMAVCLCIVLAATTAMAQQSLGTVTETVTTRRDRDLMVGRP